MPKRFYFRKEEIFLHVLFLIFVMLFIIPIRIYSTEKIIIDTDMGADCDDAGALAVAFELEREGKIEILGIIASSKDKYSIGAIDAIATYYGRGTDSLYGANHTIDIGCGDGLRYDGKNGYSDDLANDTNRYGHNIVTKAEVVSMRDKYYSILSSQPDHSVTIVVIGHTGGLYSILRNPNDRVMFREKVKKVCFMTYTGSTWIVDYNFGSHNAFPYTKFVLDTLNSLDVNCYFGCHGSHLVYTGSKLRSKYTIDNPVKRAYDIILGNVPERPSWDQLVVLFAAFGDNEWFKIESFGKLEYNSSGQTRWNLTTNKSNHYRFGLEMPANIMSDIVEDYMTKVPLKGYGSN